MPIRSVAAMSGAHDIPKPEKEKDKEKRQLPKIPGGGGKGPWGIGLAALLVIALVLYVLIRLLTMNGPQLTVKRAAPASVVFPGGSPAIAWPKQGEAAVGVQGIDSLASPAQPVVPTASLAKVMTAYVVLHDAPLAPGNDGFTYTFTPADVAAEAKGAGQLQSSLKVGPGEVLNERQLLTAVLVPSADNVAMVLANHDAGSVPAFLAKMNATAQQLGMTATNYTDPSGLSPTTVSTAADQLKLAQAAMQSPDLAQIVGMKSAAFPVAGPVPNFNPLLGQDGVFGIKTGSESQAGGNLMFAANKPAAGKNVTIYGVVMGQAVGQSVTAVLLGAAAKATTALIDSTAGSITSQTVLPAGSTVLDVTNADHHDVPVKTTQPLSALGWGGAHISLQVQPETPKLGRSLDKGAQVVKVSDPGPLSASTDATASETMPGPSFGWRFGQLP